MPEQADRLNFYTALYSIKELSELEDMKEEMKDRFGPVPFIVNRLLLSAMLRYHASYALFERIIMQRKIVTIILPKGEKQDYYKFKFVELMRFILDEYREKVRFEQKNDLMKLIIKNDFESPEKLLEFLVSFSFEVSKLLKSPSDRV
jgi:transcription-repair coupling factor (superfamily II helicase)